MRRRDRPTKHSKKLPGEAPHDKPSSPVVFRWTGFLLHRVHEISRELYETRMAEMDLRPHQVGILQVLAAEGPTVQARIADKLRIDKAALVHNINGLEDAGLVERKNHPDDGRSFIVHLKTKGILRVQEAEKMNAKISDELFQALSASERGTLRALLTKIVNSF